ncbi:MAG: RsmG family class I SAM-dependent methyltransferase [Myxococcota bacterium]|nr:RsmG family class I SAM-dependent methyltransferase [Myxococcota bacterium]
MIYNESERIHRERLAHWRDAMDLVGPGPLEPHFQDAVHSMSWIDWDGHWADLGSGAGFPGISFASRHINSTIDLVESRRKRSIFLEEVVSATGLQNATVLNVRAETLGHKSYDGVVSRAFMKPLAYLQMARELVRESGVVVLLLAQGEPPKVGGLEVFHVERYQLGDKARRAVAYRVLD